MENTFSELIGINENAELWMLWQTVVISIMIFPTGGKCIVEPVYLSKIVHFQLVFFCSDLILITFFSAGKKLARKKLSHVK